MEQYFVRLAGKEKGPLSETQIVEMYGSNLIDRNTECRSESEPAWKTIDDHFPALKYGVAPPPIPPTPIPSLPNPPAVRSGVEVPARIVITDIDIPFWSVFRLVLKWMVSAFLIACCIAPVVFILWLFAMAMIAALFNGAFSSFPR